MALVEGPCWNCGAPWEDGHFCGHCGAPRGGAPADPGQAPTVPAPRWVAVISTDRSLFDAMRAAARGLVFPTIPERRVELTGDRVRIGRPSRRLPPPELDLSGPPPDPGISREHAELLRGLDGSWAVRDLGSANGTFVGRHRLGADEPVPLPVGAKIRLGVWSRITLLRT